MLILTRKSRRKKASGVQRRMRSSGVGLSDWGSGLWEFILDGVLTWESYDMLASSYNPCIDTPLSQGFMYKNLIIYSNSTLFFFKCDKFSFTEYLSIETLFQIKLTMAPNEI